MGRDSLDVNLYRYVHNTPTSLIDPNGLAPTGKDVLDATVLALELYWEYTKGVLKGFFKDGFLGTIRSPLDLFTGLWELGGWAGNYVGEHPESFGALVSPVGSKKWQAAIDNPDPISVMGTTLTIWAAETQALPLRDQMAMARGDYEAVQGKVSPTTILVDRRMRELFQSVGESVVNEIENSTPQERAYFVGRVVGNILYLIAEFLATASVAELAKTGQLSKYIRRLEKYPILRSPRIKKTVTNIAELIAWLADTHICFVAGTPVHTAEGIKPIEDVRAGELVLTRPDGAGNGSDAPEYRPVLSTVITHPRCLYHLTCKTDDDREETLSTTDGHRFYDLYSHDWVEAQHLSPGRTLLLAEGRTAIVVRISTEDAPLDAEFTTYNFEVAETHTYFVGALAVWTHNVSRTLCVDLATEYVHNIESGMDPAEALAQLRKSLTAKREKLPNLTDAEFEEILEHAEKEGKERIGKFVQPKTPDVPKTLPSEGIAPKRPSVFTRQVEFTSTTGRTYRVFQRNDIDWNMVRTAGPRDFIGKTNAEAAREGLRPQLPDESFATLHHSQQKSIGPLYEASTRYHNIRSAKNPPLHPYKGQQHPDYPLGSGKGSLREQFQEIESPEYWRWREANR